MSPPNVYSATATSGTEDRSILKGRQLANPVPGDEVVISGASGRFPDSDDFDQFRENLYNKVDLVSDDNRRWEDTHPEIPHRTGKINKLNKFDGGFFGAHHRQIDMMDPMCRMILERAIEALYDAGVNPKELRGTKTGVFVGVCYSEAEKTWFYERLEENNYAMTGCARSMIANSISYYLNLEGPSFVVDTACSSSLYAFEHAYRAIRNGECDSALVGGTNLCLHPFVSLQFSRLGVLSKDGACKSFDCSADGYARSETVSVIYLQKAKDCRRLYATVVHAKINCDGYKEQGITYPSGDVQKKLLEEFYEECQIDPSTLSFVEAHGTGTKVGDPEEIGAIDDVFCRGRTKPLLIGSVKSNLGHTEPASGLCSIAKVIIGMENGYIPPNIYFKKPSEEMKAILSGRISVVTEKTPWEDTNGLVGINSFGFGGANCHVLLRWNEKTKMDKGLPKDDLPRLICVSGRSEESITAILDQVKNRHLDAELVRLYHDVFRYDIPTHTFRGFSVVSKRGEISRSLRYYPSEPSTLFYVFGDYDSTWLNIGYDLFALPLFAATLEKLQKTLAPFGINISELVMYNKKMLNPVNGVMAHVATQLILVDILRVLGVVPDYVVGQSIGVLAAAYSNDCLSLEQAILCAYHIAAWTKMTTTDNIADLDVPSEKLQKFSPNVVEIINDISLHSLLSEEINTKKILNNNGVPLKNHFGQYLGLHHSQSKTMDTKLLQKLSEVVPKPQEFKPNFISTTPNAHGDKLEASPQFIVDALTTPIFSSRTIQKITATNGTVLEFGTSNLAEGTHDIVGFSRQGTTNGVVLLMGALGKLYETGQNLSLEKLYPKIQYPVSRGTPMISPAIKWDHSKDWFATNYQVQCAKSGERIIGFFLKGDDWQFLSGHVIDGRNLFPATGYLNFVWETLAMMNGVIYSDCKIVFENVRFLRTTTIPKATRIELIVMVQRGTGNFEVIEGGSAVVKGRIYNATNDNEELQLPLLEGVPEHESLPMSHKDIYKELKLRGYNYSGLFKSLVWCDSSATKGLIKWYGNWVAFMDNMLQMQILQVNSRNLYVPTSIQRLTIDAKKHIMYCKELGEEPEVPVYCYKYVKIIRSGAIEMRGLNASSIARRRPLGQPVLEKYQFVPNTLEVTLQQSMRIIMQIVLENNYWIKLRIVELLDNDPSEAYEFLGATMHAVLADLPLVQPEIVVLSKKPLEIANVSVEDGKLSAETDCSVIIVTNVTSRPQVLKDALGALKPGGFVVSRENPDFDETTLADSTVEVLTVHALPSEKVVFLRQATDYGVPLMIDVGSDDFEWLPHLQEALKGDSRVVAYAQNQPLNGVVGLVNCARREPGGDKLQCVFVMDDDAPKFDPSDDFYKKQLKKNLAVNIYKDGKWGTYRHLLLDKLPLVESEHCYVNATVRGDLSSGSKDR